MRDGDSDEVFLKISEDCVDREVCEDEAGGDNRWFWREGKLKSLEPEIES